MKALLTILPDHDLVDTRLACNACRSEHTIALPGDAQLSTELARTVCPTCTRIGTMALVRHRVAS